MVALFVLFTSLLSPLTSDAQKVKSIIGTRTYLYNDTTYPDLSFTAHEYAFDHKGRLLADNDIEGVCYGSYVYDSLDRLKNENWYCGEGKSEKSIFYLPDKKITFEETNYGETKIIEKLNGIGKPVSSNKKLLIYDNWDFEKTDSMQFEYNYTYDESGREIRCEEWDGKSKIVVSHSYDHFGRMHSFNHQTKYGFSSDSLIYSYDTKNRLSRTQRWTELIDTTRSGFKKLTTIEFSYSDKKPKKEIEKFNDSIFRKVELYPYYQYEVEMGASPSKIHYKVNSLIGDDFYEEEFTISFSYDKSGRLTAFTRSGHSINRNADYQHAEFFYHKKETTVKWYVKDQDGHLYLDHVDQYKNYLLQKTEEFGKSGVMSSTMVYTYTFY